MKKTLLLFTLLLFTSFTFGQTESIAPYSVEKIDAFGNGFWFFGTSAKHSKGLYRYNNEKWEVVDNKINFKIKSLVAQDNFNAACLTPRNDIKIFSGGLAMQKWSDASGINNVKCIGYEKGNNGNLLAVGTVTLSGVATTGVFKYAQNKWVLVSSDPLAANFVSLDGGQNGQVYGVSNDGKLMIFANNVWAEFPTTNIYVTTVKIGMDNKPYIISKAKDVYLWNGSAWVKQQAQAEDIAVTGNGNLYVVLNTELTYLKNGSWAGRLSVENVNETDASGNTKLIIAVLQKNINGVTDALGEGADPSIQNIIGETALIVATKNKYTSIFDRLIQAEQNLDAVDNQNMTALGYAVQIQDMYMARRLLEAGANPDLGDPLLVAVSYKNSDLTNLLVNHNANPEKAMLQAININDTKTFKALLTDSTKLSDIELFKAAVTKNNAEIAEICLQRGIDANAAFDHSLSLKNESMITLCLNNGADPNKAIIYAVTNDNANLCTQLMQTYKADSNQLTGQAIQQKKYHLAEIGLQGGADPNAPMQVAVQNADLPLIELLLRYKGDANIVLKGGVDKKDVNMVNLAVANGANVNDGYSLKKAVENNDFPTVQVLTANGATVTDNTILPLAVGHGNVEMVDQLITNGANANDGMIPALKAGNEAMVEKLLSRGANASEPSYMDYAASSGNKGVVTMLINKGAKPDDGMIGAIRSGNKDMVQTLITMGAQTSNPDYVATAVRANKKEIVELLFQYGASTSYKSPQGETLLHLGVRTDNFNLAKLLLSKGLDINAKTNSGDTPLHYACDSGRNSIDMAALLLDNGANINERNNAGKTPYKVANGSKLRKFLKKKGGKK